MIQSTTWVCAQRKLRSAWAESSLSAWRKPGSLATHWAHSEDSDQTRRMPRLIWVFAGRTLILLVLSCRGSFVLANSWKWECFFFFFFFRKISKISEKVWRFLWLRWFGKSFCWMPRQNGSLNLGWKLKCWLLCKSFECWLKISHNWAKIHFYGIQPTESKGKADSIFGMYGLKI